MNVDDPHRHELHRRLDVWLGPTAAAHLMARLPDASNGAPATADDLARAVALVRAELRTEMAELRATRHAITTDVVSRLRVELRAELSAVTTDLRVDVASSIRAQTRRLVASGFALDVLAVVAVVAFVAIRYGP